MEERKEFDSFEEFNRNLKEWSKATNVVWIKAHSRTVSTANKNLSRNAEPFNEKFRYRNVLYLCKHGGTARHKGRGLRPNQSSFKQECPGRLFLTVNKAKTKLVVQTLVTDHNHEVSKTAFMHYPEQRRLTHGKRDEVENLLQLGVKVNFLKKYIQKKNSQVITMKDIHNIHQNLKLKVKEDKTDEELLMEQLRELYEEDPDAVISVQADNNGVLEFLLVVSGDMKESFSKFPEVLMIDCTYSTNKLRMPLFTLLVEDGNGIGQTVGYAFITHETEQTLSAVLTEMTRIHNLKKVKVVVLDKDMKEISAVKKVIPGVEVQLCKFHVIQAVDRYINKQLISQELKDKLKKTFQSLVFARSKRSFEKTLGHLAAIAPDAFMSYYNKNWGKAHQMKYWVFYKTVRHINLGNTTNNRLESHNQKVKDLLKRTMTLSEAVKSILLLHQGKVEEMNHREFNQTFKTPYRLGDYDETTDVIVKTLTPYAAGIVIDELKCARLKPGKRNAACSCSLKTSMLLPCRHLLAERIHRGDGVLFHPDDAGERWHIEFQRKIWTDRKARKRHMHDVNVDNAIHRSKRVKRAPTTKVQKYKDIMVLCKSMADFASTLGQADFQEKFDMLATVYESWLAGEKCIITNSEHLTESTHELPLTTETHEDGASQSNTTSKFDAATSTGLTTPTKSLPRTPIPSSPFTPEVPIVYNSPETPQWPLRTSLEHTNREDMLSMATKSVGTCKENTPSKIDASGLTTPTQSLPKTPMPCSPVTPKKSEPIAKPPSPIFSSSKVKRRLLHNYESKCLTGRTPEVLTEITNIKFPKTPPVKGRAKIKKTKQKQEKENILQARQRVQNNRKVKGSSKIINNDLTSVDDLIKLKNPASMLTDKHINAAQSLLSLQFPHVRGLQDTVLGSKLQFSVEFGDFVQILHDGSLHWITASNMFCDDNCVEIYDSLYSSVPINVKMQIASILMMQEQNITINTVNYQHQRGGIDCGLFAIASATDLCNKVDPSTKSYKQDLMRDHLIKCLNNRNLLPFPSEKRNVRKRVLKTIKTPLYCICRLPDNLQEKMCECCKCKEWFHKSCLSIPKAVFEGGEKSTHWSCNGCNALA